MGGSGPQFWNVVTSSLSSIVFIKLKTRVQSIHITCYESNDTGPILLRFIRYHHSSYYMSIGVVNDIYLTFLLRWKLVVNCQNPACKSRMQKIINYASSMLGVQIYLEMPPSYSQQQRIFSACISKDICTYENIMKESWGVTGRYSFAIPRPTLRTQDATHGTALLLLRRRFAALKI